MNNSIKITQFLDLIEENKKIIYKISNSYCSGREERKDLEQEMIMQLWDAFEKYDETYKFSTWMYRVALNTAISFYRKERKWSTKRAYTENALFEVEEENNEKNTTLDNNITLLHQFINQLNELNKALILLYLEGKSYSEISQILGITKTNVATKISRIKKKIKAQF